MVLSQPPGPHLPALAAELGTGASLLWVAVPYLCLAVCLGGHLWRYRHDQFGWTSRTSQLLERRWLRWASPLFHLGAFAVIGGHIVGLLIPAGWTEAVGVDEEAYHLLAVGLGSVAGAAMVLGLGMLCARRLLTSRVRHATDTSDRVLFPLLSAVVVLGVAATVVHNVAGGGYDYRATVSVWFRGLFALQPQPEAMVGAPLLFQLHALSALLLFAAWPFTRLVHVWSVPLGYLVRPYLVYRESRPGRSGAASRRVARPGAVRGSGPRSPSG